MTMKYHSTRKIKADSFYSRFDELDGRHPWMEAVPEGYVSYRVRELGEGKVPYFNFVLAKEMGLIDANHPHEMTPELQQKLVDTFSIQIINEYDELSKKRIDSSTIRPHRHMATRYLQLQHSNKQGKTSGDGRGIWNGTLSHRGKTWDVSSRGTGVTCLAPGAVQANRPLKTGGTEFGYGCGLAEIDELFGAAILAEIMHLQGISTERVLCIIDLGKGYGIGVRAALNLIRPAHLFLYLKQERHSELKAATDYFLSRQIENKAWAIKAKGSAKYDEMLEHICRSFADFTAKLDIDYIFAWLDWDGDNVLADAGIIDYGSVRQFGLRHDKYRYDDVERFSTNLNEQRLKARLIVQVFTQMVDYVKTGKRKSVKHFAAHPIMALFDKEFTQQRSDRLLYRMGFNQVQRENILKDKNLFNSFDREFSYFETAKVSGKIEKVADGVNHPALFNMRALLRVLPEHFHSQTSAEDVFQKMLSSFAKTKDMRMGEKQKRHLKNLLNLSNALITAAAGRQKPENILKGLAERAEKLNSDRRMTGNALIEVVDEILSEKKKGLTPGQIQKVIDRLIYENKDLPEANSSRFYKSQKDAPAVKVDLFAKLLNLVEQHKEDI